MSFKMRFFDCSRQLWALKLYDFRFLCFVGVSHTCPKPRIQRLQKYFYVEQTPSPLCSPLGSKEGCQSSVYAKFVNIEGLSSGSPCCCSVSEFHHSLQPVGWHLYFRRRGVPWDVRGWRSQQCCHHHNFRPLLIRRTCVPPEEPADFSPTGRSRRRKKRKCGMAVAESGLSFFQ